MKDKKCKCGRRIQGSRKLCESCRIKDDNLRKQIRASTIKLDEKEGY